MAVMSLASADGMSAAAERAPVARRRGPVMVKHAMMRRRLAAVMVMARAGVAEVGVAMRPGVGRVAPRRMSFAMVAMGFMAQLRRRRFGRASRAFGDATVLPRIFARPVFRRRRANLGGRRRGDCAHGACDEQQTEQVTPPFASLRRIGRSPTCASLSIAGVFALRTVPKLRGRPAQTRPETGRRPSPSPLCDRRRVRGSRPGPKARTARRVTRTAITSANTVQRG